MEFKEKMQSLMVKIKDKFQSESYMEAYKYIDGMLEIAEKQYHSDLIDLLKRNNIQKEIEKWIIETNVYFKNITEFEYNFKQSFIRITYNDKRITKQAIDLKDFIKTLPSVNEEYEKILIIALLSRPHIQKTFQLYFGFLKTLK